MRKFTLNKEEQKFLTSRYSYTLALNFRPHLDYRGDILAARRPMQVLVGSDDEVFYADRFSTIFSEAGKQVHVTIVPEIGHMDLMLKPAAIQAIVASIRAF